MSPFSYISRRSVITAIGLAALVPSPRVSAADTKASKATMEVLARRYDDAFNRRDAGALSSLYHQEAQIVPADEPVVQGRAAIEAFWKQILAASTISQTTRIVEVQDLGDVAVEHGEWIGKGAGGAIAEQGKYLVVWKRSGHDWQIYRETWNMDRALASSATAQEELRRAGADYDAAWLKQDAAALERLLADDYVQIDPDGNTRSRTEVLQSAKSGDVKLEVGRSDDLKTKTYGDIAISTARWTEKGTDKGKPFAGTYVNSVVYQRANGQWKVVGDQSTPIQPKNP